MTKNINLIRSTTLIKFLSGDDILTNLKSGKFKVTSYKKSSVVHFDGETCSKLEIILSGRVAVDRIDESGNLLTISEFYNDDILGGNLLFSKYPYYPMTVLTQLPTDILEIDREALFELFCNNPVFLRTYLELTSDRAFILGNKIKHYINKTIRESIMNYLNYESKIQNSNHIKLNTTKKSLAEKIGVQRTSLSRELAKMREDGLILFDTDSITLLK
ncbi:Crp/Fnr family transcriptional regulator [Dehalobacter restrictus]|uniref:Cyclic nucleotide-binding domain-containing protein n=1 Tax=Dehalobacter restrictus TaxID=55583 RepID=A0A857DKK8_9FIRM|nr:Crp/Fnr family transcriptional regulator [Dehalobacter restrictus]QHA01042.1 cyclic nucleotide-binding domain-containing protein [Dehalobacter restrictus]